MHAISIPYFEKWDNRDGKKLAWYHTASNRQDLDSNLDSMAILGRIQEMKPSGSGAALAPSCFFLPQNKDMMLELQQPCWSHEVKGKKTETSALLLSSYLAYASSHLPLDFSLYKKNKHLFL